MKVSRSHHSKLILRCYAQLHISVLGFPAVIYDEIYQRDIKYLFDKTMEVRQIKFIYSTS